MTSSTIAWIAALAALQCCAAQATKDAEEIYRSLAESGETAAGTQAVRVSVLRRVAPNEYAEVDPQTSFRSGDRVRLRVEKAAPGWLYVIQRGSRATWKLLYASDKLHMPGQRVQIPPAADFQFDDAPGIETLFVIAASQPIRELDDMRTKAAVLTEEQGRAWEGEASRSLRHRTAHKENATEGALAIYAVTGSGTHKRVVLEVSLKHM